MDETVRELFLKAAEVVDGLSERVVANAARSVTNAEVFVKIANQVSQGLTVAAGEPETGGSEDKFNFIFNTEQDKVFKDALAKTKGFLMNNEDVLNTLYKQAQARMDEWSGFTDEV